MIKFEWDESKDAANRKKHQVTFEEAKSIFETCLPQLPSTFLRAVLATNEVFQKYAQEKMGAAYAAANAPYQAAISALVRRYREKPR